MKTLKLFFLSVFESLRFGWQVIRYALIFVSAFFRQQPPWDVNWLRLEVSSPSTKKVSGRRDNPVLD